MTIRTNLRVAAAAQAELERLVLDLLPPQGAWSEAEYLWLTDRTNRLVEFTDGRIEVLPMPTDEHQSIVAYLFERFVEWVRPYGKVLFAPIRLRVGENRYREPDLVLVRGADDPRRQNRYWLGADLVLEVVSPEGAVRDLVQKRADYAAARIPEYWIVQPASATITVLRLEGEAYVEHGVFGRGARATSALLPGFAVDVSAALDAG